MPSRLLPGSAPRRMNSRRASRRPGPKRWPPTRRSPRQPSPPARQPGARSKSAYQDFLKAAAENTTVVQTAITARTEAQRQVWQSSLQAVRASAAGAIDHARVEADAALKLLSAETEKAGKLLSAEAEKAGTTLGHVSSAGEESWKLIKAGLDETVSAFERTWKKVYKSVSNIR